jgi:hypothetical protein
MHFGDCQNLHRHAGLSHHAGLLFGAFYLVLAFFPLPFAFRLIGPSSIFEIPCPKLSVDRVSDKLLSAGLKFTNIHALASPPSESCKMWVSLEFRYGTCF